MSVDKFDWEKRRKIGNTKQSGADFIQANYAALSDAQIAAALSDALGRAITLPMVRLRRQAMGLEKSVNGVALTLLDSDTARYTDPPRLTERNVLVLADVHAPFQDGAWLRRVLEFARQHQIVTVLLAGDFLDLHTLSNFTPAMLAEESAADDPNGDPSAEIEAAAGICEVLLDQFEQIHYILGNHEARLSRRLAVQLRVKFLRQLLGLRKEKRFNIYPYYHATLTSGADDWRITHPRNYSRIPGRVACALADKYRCHVIAAHGHDWGEMTSPSGYYAASSGMCADPVRIEYAQIVDSTAPLMQQGAWALVDGAPVLLHPRFAQPERA